jgi:hypothetical protein
MMKKMLLLILITMITLPVLAPNLNQLVVLEPEPIKPFQCLIRAIGMVESSLDTLAYNKKEKATGFFQIRPIRVRDYNKRTGSTYSLNDMFDYYTAEKVFLYYADRIGPYNMELIARQWNGSGPKTKEYWKLVKSNL